MHGVVQLPPVAGAKKPALQVHAYVLPEGVHPDALAPQGLLAHGSATHAIPSPGE